MALMALSAATARADMPQLAGWTLQFGDDFNGAQGRLPSPAQWIIDRGHRYDGGPPAWGNREVQRYTRDPANLGLDGHGHLRITPRRDAEGHWTSGRIESRADTFQPPPGGIMRLQARIRMPDVKGRAALGYWPAFWSLGRSYRKRFNWPHAGEFDVMENANGINQVWGTLHCGFAPGGPCSEPSGLGKTTTCPRTACAGHFHTYRFEWDRRHGGETLRWYVDDRLYHRIDKDQLPYDIWQTLVAQHGFFILLNVAIGGDFPYAMAGNKETPRASTAPARSMLVDYVAVWTRHD